MVCLGCVIHLSCTFFIFVYFYRFRIAVYYDSTWLAKYLTDAESINAARRVIANSQIIFRWPSLTIPIILEVASIKYHNGPIPADVSGL